MWQLYCPRYASGNRVRGGGVVVIGLHKFAPAPNAPLSQHTPPCSWLSFRIIFPFFPPPSLLLFVFFLWASQICRILLCCRLYGVIFCGHKYTPKMLMTAKRGKGRGGQANKQNEMALCLWEWVGGQIHGQIVWQFALVLYFNFSQKTSIDKCFGRTVGQAAHHMSNCEDLDEYS